MGNQNRKAPSYQEYPAEMMACLPYRIMTLQDRGLLYTMRQECWVNSQLPQNPEKLAKVLGLDAREVAESLSAVMPFFDVQDGFIFSPELENYRAYLKDRKERMSSGGKHSAEIRNNKRKPAKRRSSVDGAGTLQSTLSSTLQAPRQGVGKVLVKSSTVKPSQELSLGRSDTLSNGSSDWVDEYADNRHKFPCGVAS